VKFAGGERKKFNLLAFLILAGASAALANVQTPPEVEAEAQDVEARFGTVLKEECAPEICAPVGCEVLRFRTLDQTQNSSLPGLDVGDEAPAQLQYKLEAIHCEFAYEPSLSAEALTSLRQRVTAKARASGVSLQITGRRLEPTSPGLRGAPPVKPAAPLAGPDARPGEPWTNALAQSLPSAVLIVLGTLGVIALIWAFRRLGKPRPVVVSETSASEAKLETLANVEKGPSAFAIMNKREQLKGLLLGDRQLAETALLPLVSKGEVEDLCRVLQHFGPEPLAELARKAEYRELFLEVRGRFEKVAPEESNVLVGEFLDKVERLVALAQLGRPEVSVHEELAFARDLEPDEFAQLVQGISNDELMAILSFVPANLRARFLQGCNTAFIESYMQHVLTHPRISDQMVRRIAQQMREQFTTRHAEIRNVTREQLPVVEHLLGTLHGEKRERLLARLKKEQPALYDKVISETIFDRALVKLPESVLNDLFLGMSPEDGAAYLDQHPDRAAILAKLKGPLATAILNRSRITGAPIGLALDFVEKESPQVVEARQKINETIRMKSARGEVNLRSLNESVAQL